MLTTLKARVINLHSNLQISLHASFDDRLPINTSQFRFFNFIMGIFFKFFGEEGFKAIRLMNKRLLAASRNCKSKHLKFWRFTYITPERIKEFMNDVQTIKGMVYSMY